MSTKPGPKKKKQTKKHDWSFYAIIICSVALAIPAAILGASAISAAMASNKPIIGDRFEGQFDNVIEASHKKELKESLSSLENVSDVKVELITGTLRVYLVIPQDISWEAYDGIMDAAYGNVTSLLPLDQYFTKDDSFHRYDLEINMINMIKPEKDAKENFLFYSLLKNSSNAEPSRTYLSTPLSQEFVDEMWAISDEQDKPVEKGESELPETINPDDVTE